MAEKSAILKLIELRISMAYPSLKVHILFYSDGLAIWHSCADIGILKSINNERKSTTLNFIESKFSGNIPPKQYILFYTNDLAIWHSFPDILHTKVNNGSKLTFFRAYVI